MALPKNRHPANSHSGREKSGGLVAPVLSDCEVPRVVINHSLLLSAGIPEEASGA